MCYQNRKNELNLKLISTDNWQVIEFMSVKKKVFFKNNNTLELEFIYWRPEQQTSLM